MLTFAEESADGRDLAGCLHIDVKGRGRDANLQHPFSITLVNGLFIHCKPYRIHPIWNCCCACYPPEMTRFISGSVPFCTDSLERQRYHPQIMPILDVVSETHDKMTICFAGCVHDVCALRHSIAFSYCTRCNTTIGYRRRFHRDPDHQGFVHSDCLAHEIQMG